MELSGLDRDLLKEIADIEDLLFVRTMKMGFARTLLILV